MGSERFARTGRLIRNGSAAAAAALAAAVLAGGGAAAAAHRDGVTARHAGAAPAGTISTVAGGVGGPAKATGMGLDPGGLAFGAGRVYVADAGAVRAINPQNDRLTTVAGTRARGPLGDGGPAADASLDKFLGGVAVDHAHNLVIADSGNNRIRVVASRTATFYGKAMTAGHIYTVAGNGVAGGAGNGGPATGAELNNPADVAVGADGNLVIADTENHEIRIVAVHTGTFFGQHMTAGNIYAITPPPSLGEYSNFTPDGVAVDAAGNAVVSDYGLGHLWVVAARTGTFYGQAMKAGHNYAVAGNGTTGYSGDGGPAVDAAIAAPRGVAVDAAGNLVFADGANNRVRVVAASTGTFYGQAMTAADIYTVAGTGARGYSGNRGPATSAKIYAPDGVTFDRAGNLVIADSGNHRARVVAASTGTFYGQAMTAGDIYSVAGNGHQRYSGDGGPATNAELSGPWGVAADAAGNMLIADTDNNRVRVTAVSTGTFYGRAMTAGHIYTVAGNGLKGHSGDGGPATKATLTFPEGVAVDSHGNLLIAATGNSLVRVVADTTGVFYGQTMTAGDIYTIAGNGHRGFSGDGGPATSAAIFSPAGVTVDAAGNVLIADSQNSRVRVVATTTATSYGIAMTAGDIYTIAGNGTEGFSGDGGPATSAEMAGPATVTVDAAGNVLITDYGNDRVRVVAAGTGTFYGRSMTAGDIYTIAGDGTEGFGGDGGLATSAELDGPQGMALDAAGNVLIADSYNRRVRVVAARTGTFYGHSMTAGDIYTIAGNGGGGALGGFSGDGGPATGAELSYPSGVAVNAAGNVLIADQGNDRIRMVTG